VRLLTLDIRLGTDVVYVPRIQATLERFGERFLQRVYTPAEQKDCWQSAVAIAPSLEWEAADRRTNAPIQRLAGRWAAKEAIVKALGTGWQGVRYRDVEIQRQSSGAPMVKLYGAAAQRLSDWQQPQWQLSLSHDGDYAIATVILFCLA